MQKNEVLEQLRAAKAAHINWVQRAKLLISGFQVDESSIPVNSTQCQFGKWFYSDAQKLNAMQNNPMECMSSIEQLHFDLHDIYLNIYKIYYETESKGFFEKIFGKKKKITDEAKTLAKEYFNNMEEVSKKLVAEINRMERRIVAISEKEFEAL
ncbi:CZB domain-containing protein [Sulfurovum sp. zt1-1]|uniref:CZB domain-containing protein n=1 Tax=Sulfurovum zhangzhouensis TaxID=3019067 RepID=A0ABT7QUV9_9BACT|nr:CZB domain-containing protein [Sulfurovum zhangzhouensis]MDM5270630.1 CZB domain-containing protein [Sulfurovum zhangzhouensis]